jgi:hypothetical protein
MIMKPRIKWYFIINSALITVRARTKAKAYQRARAQFGIA